VKQQLSVHHKQDGSCT